MVHHLFTLRSHDSQRGFAFGYFVFTTCHHNMFTSSVHWVIGKEGAHFAILVTAREWQMRSSMIHPFPTTSSTYFFFLFIQRNKRSIAFILVFANEVWMTEEITRNLFFPSLPNMGESRFIHSLILKVFSLWL